MQHISFFHYYILYSFGLFLIRKVILMFNKSVNIKMFSMTCRRNFSISCLQFYDDGHVHNLWIAPMPGLSSYYPNQQTAQVYSGAAGAWHSRACQFFEKLSSEKE